MRRGLCCLAMLAQMAAFGAAVAPRRQTAADARQLQRVQLAPEGWLCPASWFRDGEYCDCACGIADPDCGKDAVQLACGGTADLGLAFTCGECTAPLGFTCQLAELSDGMCSCDCGGGSDPECNPGSCLDSQESPDEPQNSPVKPPPVVSEDLPPLANFELTPGLIGLIVVAFVTLIATCICIRVWSALYAPRPPRRRQPRAKASSSAAARLRSAARRPRSDNKRFEVFDESVEARARRQGHEHVVSGAVAPPTSPPPPRGIRRAPAWIASKVDSVAAARHALHEAAEESRRKRAEERAARAAIKARGGNGREQQGARRDERDRQPEEKKVPRPIAAVASVARSRPAEWAKRTTGALKERAAVTREQGLHLPWRHRNDDDAPSKPQEQEDVERPALPRHATERERERPAEGRQSSNPLGWLFGSRKPDGVEGTDSAVAAYADDDQDRRPEPATRHRESRFGFLLRGRGSGLRKGHDDAQPDDAVEVAEESHPAPRPWRGHEAQPDALAAEEACDESGEALPARRGTLLGGSVRGLLGSLARHSSRRSHGVESAEGAMSAYTGDAGDAGDMAPEADRASRRSSRRDQVEEEEEEEVEVEEAFAQEKPKPEEPEEEHPEVDEAATDKRRDSDDDEQ